MDIIETWYVKLDKLFGRIYKRINEDPKLAGARILVVSDHGFGKFQYKVNLNRWLLNQGYLVSTNVNSEGDLSQVNWLKTKLYALGLNSLYINMAGREEKGQVGPGDRAKFMEKISNQLASWKGPDGRPVVARLIPGDDAFQGPYAKYGPDWVVGYSSGYRASAQTGLGEWGTEEIETNEDHWGADHCFDPDLVPGVIFANHGLGNFPKPTYADFPRLTLDKEIVHSDKDVDPRLSDEDQEKVNQRLKELGYL
jgi:predicted AlkP superfamily phosphohydrolase/phosphomutase